MNFEEEPFLEPAHQHSLEDLSRIVAGPPLSDYHVRKELVDMFRQFYVSSSIALSSLQRTRLLYEQFVLEQRAKSTNRSNQRFDQEIYLYNAQRRLKAERCYFVDEVMPDWFQKELVLRTQLTKTDIGLELSSAYSALESWLIEVKVLVNHWFEEFRALGSTSP
jgi:hypothetical protein